MSVEWNIAVVRRIIDGLNNCDTTIFDQLFQEDVSDWNSLPDQAPGIEGVREAQIIYQNAFPDFQLSAEDLVAQGDKVVVRWVLRGTHSGEFLGIPATNRRICVTGIDMYRLFAGKVTEWWHPVSIEALKQQLTTISSSLELPSLCPNSIQNS